MPIQKASESAYRVFNSEPHRPALNNKVHVDGKGKDKYFGVPFDELRIALDSGRADFQQDYVHADGTTVSADNLVQFYCHTMMKGHFFSARSNFLRCKDELKKAIRDASRVVLIDVGCGAGTGGLAFSECFPTVSFTYYGIDSARSMRNKCRSVLQAAQREGVV